MAGSSTVPWARALATVDDHGHGQATTMTLTMTMTMHGPIVAHLEGLVADRGPKLMDGRSEATERLAERRAGAQHGILGHVAWGPVPVVVRLSDGWPATELRFAAPAAAGEGAVCVTPCGGVGTSRVRAGRMPASRPRGRVTLSKTAVARFSFQDRHHRTVVTSRRHHRDRRPAIEKERLFYLAVEKCLV